MAKFRTDLKQMNSLSLQYLKIERKVNHLHYLEVSIAGSEAKIKKKAQIENKSSARLEQELMTARAINEAMAKDEGIEPDADIKMLEREKIK